ncbi:hypothetical protein P3L10_004424 [Capsicum annuum]
MEGTGTGHPEFTGKLLQILVDSVINRCMKTKVGTMEEQIAQAVMLALGVCEKAFFGSKNLLQLYESEG